MLVEIRSRDYVPQPDDDMKDLDSTEDITIALHPNCVIADLWFLYYSYEHIKISL